MNPLDTAPPVATTPRASVVIAGGSPRGFTTARWVDATGDHAAIGQALAEAAWAAHGELAFPRPVPDAFVEAVRREWFRTNYPAMSARMQGVATAFGLDHDRHDLDLALLGSYRLGAGCSVVRYPGSATRDGHEMLGRNFDFPTARYGDIVGHPSRFDDRPLGADPWVVRTSPEDGYASVTVGIMDVLGAMDGINEAGLAVALLADNESPRDEPTSSQVGLSEQQVVRYLLDTCATAGQARRALLLAKHYYTFVPCHFVVADAGGDAFVWEHSPGRNREYAVRPSSRDVPLTCTNHLLAARAPAPHRDGDVPTAFAADIAEASRQRLRTLQHRAETDEPVDQDTIRSQLADVAFTAPDAGTRTLWTATYDLTARSVSMSFFLRDECGASRYSPLLRFTPIRRNHHSPSLRHEEKP